MACVVIHGELAMDNANKELKLAYKLNSPY
jgi:hypothetical protein